MVRLFGYPFQTALLMAVGLTQIGEFSFVLVQVARSAGHVGAEVYNATLAASLLNRASDGLGGDEGTFSVRTFWLVEALTRRPAAAPPGPGGALWYSVASWADPRWRGQRREGAEMKTLVGATAAARAGILTAGGRSRP